MYLPAAFTPKLFTVLKNGYTRQLFKADLVAGLTVAIVALPLAMALAIASGASPEKGLLTAVVAGFIISLLGGSRVQIGGPTGAFVVVVYNIIAQHGYDGLLLATAMAGIILVVAGYARLGQVIRLIPHPVITGFTAGIAVIIATSQVRDFLGLTLPVNPADFVAKWHTYFQYLHTTSLPTMAVGGAALAVIVLLRRLAPKLPGYLLAVVFASAAVAVLQLPVETIGSRFPNLNTGFVWPQMPAWSFDKLQQLLPSAFTIAFLAGIEALLSAVVADGMTGYRHRSNQELVGQGVANLASAAFGGLPATGAIARTATNIRSGGKTPVAGMAHAAFLLLFMLFVMDVVAYVPMAALAAVLFVVAWGMSESRHFVHILKLSAADRAVLLLSFGLTVFVDLTVAIAVGVTLASLLFVKQMSKTVAITTDTQPLSPSELAQEEETQRENLPDGVEVCRINGPLFFGVATELVDTLKAMGQMPQVLIIRMKLVPYLDASGAAALETIVQACRSQGTCVIFSAVQPQPHKMLQRAGVVPGHPNGSSGIFFAETYPAALQQARTWVGAGAKKTYI